MTESQEEFRLDLSFPREQFSKHLVPKDNKRIVFSGPFGSGKTYFLNEFFSDPEKYVYVRLAPVNYAVSHNEDIFELIKFDILFELLKKGVPKGLRNASKNFLLQYNLRDPDRLLSAVLEINRKIGKSSVEVLTQFKGLLKANNPPKTDLDPIEQFLEQFIQGESHGNLYEQDAMTQFIFALVSEISKSTKESILVIDDLDRMDPEHIFRILNVFAAHFDMDTTENKFGFDRVVLVCDIENVRRIFFNRYGQDINFSGYIDKFYSRIVFQFDNTKALEGKISEILLSINLKTPANFDFEFKNTNSFIHDFIISILIALLRVNGTNMRSIIRLWGKDFQVENHKIPYKGSPLNSQNYALIQILELLITIVGDLASLREGFNRCKALDATILMFDHNNFDLKSRIGLIIPVLILPDRTRSQETKRYKTQGLTIHYNLVPYSNSRSPDFAEIEKITKGVHEVESIDIFQLLIAAIDKLQVMKILK